MSDKSSLLVTNLPQDKLSDITDSEKQSDDELDLISNQSDNGGKDDNDGTKKKEINKSPKIVPKKGSNEDNKKSPIISPKISRKNSMTDITNANITPSKSP